MSAELSGYWADVSQRWDTAELAASTHRAPKTKVRSSPYRSFMTRILGSEMPIVITGERGAGKTELYRALTGALPMRREGISESREDMRAAVDTGRGKIRSTFLVVPGQDSDPNGKELEDLFSGGRGPRGLIHVVTAGHDHIWGEAELTLVEAALVRQQDKRQAEIDELEAVRAAIAAAQAKAETARKEAETAARAVDSAESVDVAALIAEAQHAAQAAAEAAGRFTATDADRLACLTELGTKPLSWHLSESQKQDELKRFRLLCRDHLKASWGRLPSGGQPIWMIIAVAKCDLWFEDREAVKKYYVPSTNNADSSFAAELRDFVAEIGAARLGRLAILPVASYPQPRRLTAALGEQRSTLGKQNTDSLLNHFRNTVGEFCANR